MDRYLVFSATIGDFNRNLVTESSVKKYRHFFIPSFDDLYRNRHINKNNIYIPGDNLEYDIRKLPSFLFSGSIDMIEMLYSRDFESRDNNFTDWLLDNRDLISTMNLIAMFNICLEMFYREYSCAFRRYELSDYNYAASALRYLDFLERMVKFGLDFEKALWYNIDDGQEIRFTREGRVSDQTLFQLFGEKRSRVEKLRSNFSKSKNKTLYKELEKRVYSLVRYEYRW